MPPDPDCYVGGKWERAGEIEFEIDFGFYGSQRPRRLKEMLATRVYHDVQTSQSLEKNAMLKDHSSWVSENWIPSRRSTSIQGIKIS